MKKITEYAFVEKDKKILFEKYMGYTLAEAQELYDIIKAQSIENYGNGNYVIGELNKYGQRISIPCTIRSKGRTPEKEYYFYTGWMVFPNGKIKNNTPFGGFIK
ncbi:MAG: hypothetical protein LBT20_00370 [Clostridiales bacterium]|nr:hypothetical protein [Clostridiales bacterium]